MNSTQAKQRISELSKWLKNWNASYHSGIGDAQNLTSEQARDALKRELETLEKQYPELILPDSPTQRVGAPLSEQLPPIKHLTQKKSLPDAFSQKEVEEWIERGKKFSSELGMFFCETKIDGLNITVHYEKGKFIRALTRGDGKIGEDVSHSIRTISDVPLELPEPINIEVSGEVFIPIEKFVEINQEREKNNEDLFANPRNAAAGTVRTLDPTISAKRGLKMIFYELGQNNLQNPPKSQSELFKFFQRIGLPIAPDNLYQKCVNIKEISEFFDKIGKIRDDLKFGIDGIVVKIDDFEIREALGYTAKTPRWAMAWKFPAEEAATVIQDIEIQIGRTGALTPVAILQPVILSGSTVSRATLHNEDEIERKDIRISDTVVVRKAGDIIPEVVRVISDLRPKNSVKFEFPKICPFCNNPVLRPMGEVVIRCINRDCFAATRQKLIHFASKNAADIDGLGDVVIDQLLEKGLVSDAADFYTLTEGDLSDLPLFKEKKVTNLLAGISDRRVISLDRFLFAIGIRFMGEKTAQDLTEFISQRYPDMSQERFVRWLSIVSQEELSAVPGIGKKVGQAFSEHWQDDRNLALLHKFLNNGVQIDFKTPEKKSSKLAGKIFVLTGALPNLTRSQAKELIIKHGGAVSSSVSSHTDFVLTGDSAGSKLDKARKLGVRVIDEKEFIATIEKYGGSR